MARRNRTASAITHGTTAPRLTRGDNRVLIARYLLAAGVVLASGVMSYQALADLNARGHIADQWRWVWPVIFVCPEVSGALAVIEAQRRQQGAAWSWFLLVTATSVSVAANVWAAPADTLSRTVHGIVPVVGFVQIKDICNGIRKRLEAAADEVTAVPNHPPAPALEWAANAVPRVIAVPVREPAAVPPRPARPPAAPRTEPPPSKPRRRTAKKGVGDIAFARHVKQARPYVEDNPKITGKEIGEILGTNDSYGRRVKRAVTA